mmetsp:Transcript_12145/g.35525  ORF Transcript_12145/g.35525 Transcript_12145/m.35525 type:complete len:463 (-) Transcript_12145:220-1608(-)
MPEMTTVRIAWKVPDSGSPFEVQRIAAAAPSASSAASPNSPPRSSADETAAGHPSSVAICNVHDYQRLARSRLPKPLYEYLASGTDDEQTLSQNVDAFKQYFLRPRVMRPVSSVSTRIELFGRTLHSPVFVSPAGVHALCDPIDGECSAARACARVGTLFGLSQHSTRTIEEVADAVSDTSHTAADAPNLWYQSYILKDRALTLRLIRRAVNRGYRGVFLTVDSARFGYREADARNGWDALPEPHRLVNYDEPENPSSSSSSSAENDGNGGAMDQTYNARDHASWDQNSERMFDTDATWDDVAWLKREGCPNLPLVIKGIMTGEDALLALDAGADGIMVSNHGGRGLDGALSSIDVLPDVVRAVRGAGSRAPILLDGGIRRGSDVVKALALGASAVGVGKPVFFSLAVGGEDAVANMLNMLRRETEACMAICGAASVRDITERLVTRHPSGGPAVPYVRAKL